MNRWITLSSLLVVSAIAGVITTSLGDQSEAKRSLSWQPTAIPDNSLESRALEVLAGSTRWEFVDESGPQNQHTGEFAGRYRLVAIVAGDRSYAVLEANDFETPEPVSRVSVGDELPNSWVVTEIEKAAVVATREGESQRVELFPEH